MATGDFAAAIFSNSGAMPQARLSGRAALPRKLRGVQPVHLLVVFQLSGSFWGSAPKAGFGGGGFFRLPKLIELLLI